MNVSMERQVLLAAQVAVRFGPPNRSEDQVVRNFTASHNCALTAPSFLSRGTLSFASSKATKTEEWNPPQLQTLFRKPRCANKSLGDRCHPSG